MKIEKESIQMKSQMKAPINPAIRSLFLVIATLMMAAILVGCGGGEKEAAQHDAGEHTSGEQSAGVAQQSASASAADTTVNVVARDFEFSLDSNSANAGTISFVIANEGSMPHDFAITIDGERYKTEMIKPGSSGSLTVELPAGSYEYICTIPGHDVLGMKGTFTVN